MTKWGGMNRITRGGGVTGRRVELSGAFEATKNDVEKLEIP
jgi:hypothetical protein